VTIVRYEWDDNCDGSYEREQGQFLFERVFPPNTRLGDFCEVGQTNDQDNCIEPGVVCLRVTDSNGNVGVSEPHRIRYQELGTTDPFADADPSDAPEQGYHVLQGDGVNLDGSSSFDPDSDDFDDFIQEYRWTIAGNRNAGTTKVANDENDQDAQKLELDGDQLVALGVEAVGLYDIQLLVTDTTGNTGQDLSMLTVHRKDSSINVVINPVETSPNSRVTFDASRSEHSHPDIEVTEVIWFFGDLVEVGGDCFTDVDCDQGYCITNPDTDALRCMDGSIGS
jgi:hypothetical protein